MPTVVVPLVIITIIAYLWGSLPSGYWMGKLLRGRDFDIRQHGSHKIGASNVQRTLGIVPGLIVLFLDLSKGIGPALLATFVPFFQQGAGWGPPIAGLAALLGHCFPIFIGFKGGRGVLTAWGALLPISPLAFGIGGVITLSIIGIFRYISLACLIGCLTSIVCGIIFYLFGLVGLPQMLYMLIASVLIIIFHADNIGRLLKGTERKFGITNIKQST